MNYKFLDILDYKKIYNVQFICNCGNKFKLYTYVSNKKFRKMKNMIVYDTAVCYKCSVFLTGKDKLTVDNIRIRKILKSKKNFK